MLICASGLRVIPYLLVNSSQAECVGCGVMWGPNKTDIECVSGFALDGVDAIETLL